MYSSSTETKAHVCFFLQASLLVSIMNSRGNVQNQILSIRSFKAPSEIPGGRINTQSWLLVFCHFFGSPTGKHLIFCLICPFFLPKLVKSITVSQSRFLASEMPSKIAGRSSPSDPGGGNVHSQQSLPWRRAMAALRQSAKHAKSDKVKIRQLPNYDKY